MPDAPTPLDLDVIAAAIAECRTYNFGMYQADRLAHEHAPALVEEVNRLRAEVARLAPAWDEDAKREGAIKALRDAAAEMTELGQEEYTARAVSDWLSGHADRLAAEGGADRG